MTQIGTVLNNNDDTTGVLSGYHPVRIPHPLPLVNQMHSTLALGPLILETADFAMGARSKIINWGAADMIMIVLINDFITIESIYKCVEHI